MERGEHGRQERRDKGFALEERIKEMKARNQPDCPVFILKEYELRRAKEEQVSDFIGIIKERIAWMEEKGMRQWNDEEYLEFYSEDYFRGHARNGRLFFLTQGETKVGAAALLEQDERWEEDTRYFYIHHLATRTGIPGAGGIFLELMAAYAKSLGKKGIRLDCQAENEPLNHFYEDNGYVSVGEPFTAGGYVGIRKVLEF